MDNEHESAWIFGWKNIGAYLGKSAKTAQHYAREGLPVFRDPGRRPMARRDQLDKYLIDLNREMSQGGCWKEPGISEALDMVYEEQREAKELEDKLVHAQRRPRSMY